MHDCIRNIKLFLEGSGATSDDLHENCHLSNNISYNQVSNQHHDCQVELLKSSSGEKLIAAYSHDRIIHAHEVLEDDRLFIEISLSKINVFGWNPSLIYNDNVVPKTCSKMNVPK